MGMFSSLFTARQNINHFNSHWLDREQYALTLAIIISNLPKKMRQQNQQSNHSNSFRPRSPQRPQSPRRLRRRPPSRRRRLILLQRQSDPIHLRPRHPRTLHSLRQLRRPRRRLQHRRDLRRYPALPPFPECHASPSCRQERALRKGVHRQCGPGEDFVRSGPSEESFPDGGGLDSLFPVECAGSRDYSQWGDWGGASHGG